MYKKTRLPGLVDLIQSAHSTRYLVPGTNLFGPLDSLRSALTTRFPEPGANPSGSRDLFPMFCG